MRSGFSFKTAQHKHGASSSLLFYSRATSDLLPIFTVAAAVQTWLLFHNALSEGVVIDDILKYARMSKEQAHEVEDSLEEDHQLRRLVQSQTAELEILRQRVSRQKGVT